MAEIRPSNYTDKEYDSYGCTVMAILEVDGVSIPLSGDSVKELTESLEEFNNTIFCYKCHNFIMNEYGWKYGGSCQHKAAEDGEVVTKENAGYKYCVGCMDTCPSGRLKEEE